MQPMPTPIPMLYDDVLRIIFCQLSTIDLYSVSQCNHDFQRLAEDVFRFEHGGRYSLDGDRSELSKMDHVQMLRLFGKNARHFDGDGIPSSIVVDRSTRFWSFLEPRQLESLTIDPRALHAYTKLNSAMAFTQLENLKFTDLYGFRLRFPC